MAKELTEADKFFVKEFYGKMDVKELASKLGDGIGPKTVQRYVDELKVENPNLGVDADDLMGRQKSADGKPLRGHGTSVVMTEAASQILDEQSKSPTTAPVGRSKKSIHNPRK